MFCDEVIEAIEPIAAGEVTPEGRVAAHLATCPNCAAALDDARRLDRMLKARAVPAPSAQFTSRTLARVRRERWRREQFVDMGFNVVLGLVVLGIVGAVWLFFHRSGLVSVSGDAVTLLGSGLSATARRVAPSVPLYVGALALLLSAVGIWWWAERDAAI